MMLSTIYKCQDVQHTVRGIKGGGLCRAQVNSQQERLESLQKLEEQVDMDVHPATL